MPIRKQPDIPWRRVRFIPARKQAGLNGGGRVHAEVFLDDEWHTIAFEMDREGFVKLLALPDISRTLLLDSLACMPVRANCLGGAEKKRPRGRNTKSSLIAWHTARTLAPPLFRWAKEAAVTGSDKFYESILIIMTREGCSDASPEAVTCFLLERNWFNAHKLNPRRFPPWSRSATSSNPDQFLKQIILPGTEATGLLPDSPERLISNILSGDEQSKVYVISCKDIESTFPMADFRIY